MRAGNRFDGRVMLLVLVLLLSGEPARRVTTTQAFAPTVRRVIPTTSPHNWHWQLNVHLDREADLLEQFVGGARYELNELPDSMMATTVFVGNLNEFVHDEDLAALFARVSSLQTVPACVVRKPDMSSLRYGFVSFPSVQEKEAAIIRFHGTEFRGQQIKVEAIKDTPGGRRVRIPESMIAYVSGGPKKMKQPRKKKSANNGSDGNSVGSLRSVSVPTTTKHANKNKQQLKRKAGGSASNVKKNNRKPRWSDAQLAELERAHRKGFITVSAHNSRLASAHRTWCDGRRKPHICLVKQQQRFTAQTVDQVVVDLSPLRLGGTTTTTNDDADVSAQIAQFKADILTAASGCGMKLCGQMDEYDEENASDNSDKGESALTTISSTASTASIPTTQPLRPIDQLPAISLIFQGERHQAKEMAKTLALLWEVPAPAERTVGSIARRRRRGGGHRQAWG